MVHQERFKGHSKWDNIKHIKASTDARKGALASRFSFLIRIEAIKNGADPHLNTTLAKLIGEAQKAGVRSETIKRQLDKVANAKIKTFMMDAMGPGRCLLLIETETDNVSRTRMEIKTVLRKTKGYV